MPRVLLLIPADSYRTRDFLRAAHHLGVEAVVGSDKEPAYNPAGCKALLALPFDDPATATARIVEFNRTHRLDAVIAVDDAGTQLAARASAALALRGSPEEAVVAASNKLVFREILAAAGLPGPAFHALPVSEQPAAAARAASYPCVLKPLFLNGSRGVIRADSPAAFEAAFKRIQSILAEPDVAERGGALAETVLVESYLPGAEAALEGTVVAGELRVLAILDKPEPLEGPYFQETMFVTPSRLAAAAQGEMARLGQAAVAALGLREGPVHAEFRIDGSRVTLLELAPRSIGGNCARVLRFGTGEALEVVILRQALGIPMQEAAREAQAAGVMMIPIPRRGALRGVSGLGAARSVSGIKGVEITLARGQAAVPPPEGHQYLGFIYAHGESATAVEQALRAAHGALRIDLE